MSLPTKIKMGIRDSWDNPHSDVQKAIAKLKTTLGHPVHITPQWQLLWTDLESTYQDSGIFVPSVASVVAAWCTSMETLLEKEENEEWADECLEKMNSTHGVNLRLEVDNKAKRPTTSWSKEKSCFMISIPKARLPGPSTIIAGFNDDLLSAFKPPTSTFPLHGTAAGASDDWADVQVDSSTGQARAVDAPSKPVSYSTKPKSNVPGNQQAQEPEFLPSVDTLPRPEDLLLLPPYHLLLTGHYGSELEIQCSHGPSLQLLSDYLKKWTKQNFRDIRHPPSIDVVLEESPIGLGLLFNRLVVKPQSRSNQVLSPVVVLAFVEAVLGFRLVSSEGGVWHFRREGELRRL